MVVSEVLKGQPVVQKCRSELKAKERRDRTSAADEGRSVVCFPQWPGRLLSLLGEIRTQVIP